MDMERETISHPIMVSEAYYLMNSIKSRYKNTRSTSYKTFKETFDYCEKFCKIKDKSFADDLRTTLSEYGFNEEEISALGSILPLSRDDAKICVPSISRLPDNVIDMAIDKIQLIF